jgi:hypothetical protein
MSKIERVNDVVGKSPTEIYETAIQAFEETGFTVWKKRPIAWLMMVRKTVDGETIDGNLSARMGAVTSYILTLAADRLPEEKVAQSADLFVEALNRILSA